MDIKMAGMMLMEWVESKKKGGQMAKSYSSVWRLVSCFSRFFLEWLYWVCPLLSVSVSLAH